MSAHIVLGMITVTRYINEHGKIDLSVTASTPGDEIPDVHDLNGMLSMALHTVNSPEWLDPDVGEHTSD